MFFNFHSPYFYRTALFVLFAELISLLGAIYPEYRSIAFALVAGVALVVTLERLEWGVLLLLAELAIGSKGYLFALPIAGTEIPIRIALWCIVLAVWLARIRLWWPNVRTWLTSSLIRTLLVLMTFVALGAIRGWSNGHALNYFFLDLNAWFYFALAGPFLTVYCDRAAWVRLMHVLLAASIISAAKVLGLLYIFTHDPYGAAAPTVYRWIRTTGVGEMAKLSGGLYRIFFQSQLWTLVAFFFTLCASRVVLAWRQRIILISVSALLLSSLILSFSRSLWVAGSVGVISIVMYVGIVSGWNIFQRFLFSSIVIAVCAFSIIYGTIYFPYPRFWVPVDFAAALEERATTDDVATASRWNLLPRLWARIADHWILGSGFGATVTYRSTDPRIVQQSARGYNLYTTYAFEWGYLDLWLKLGIGGLSAYGALLIALLANVYRRLRDDAHIALWVAVSIIGVAVTHVFTPYLNHPLGIAVVLLAVAYTMTPVSRQSEDVV